MNLDILEENKYISAALASQKIGYASDYIGQLCRSGKIPAKLVGRTWYIDLNSLIRHKQNRHLGRRKRLLDRNGTSLNKGIFSYRTEETPLFPVLTKLQVNEFSPKEIPFIKRTAILIFSIIIVLGVGSLFDSKVDILPYFLEDLLMSADFAAEERTGARVSEYVALLLESVREFMSISQTYVYNFITQLTNSVNHF